MLYKNFSIVVFSLLVGILPVQASEEQGSKGSRLEQLDSDKIQLGAVKAAVMELGSGKMLYSKHSDWVTPIASITKLMTAMVVLDSDQSLSEMIAIPKPDLNTRKNAYTRMRVDSKLSRGDLLRLALMSSENVAAYTLAYRYPGGMDQFVAAMNAKAKSLGMQNSHFVDSSGLSSGNVSTAADLVKMIEAAAEYDEIREYSTTGRFTAHFHNPRYSLNYGNTNRLVRRSSWNIELSKTGYITEAGRCLVVLSEMKGKEYAMVFLDAFGKLTPLGDAGRVRRWITTGDGGAVAGAALQYQKDKAKEYPYLDRASSL